MTKQRIEMPVEFPGTLEEKKKNRLTHQFVGFDDEYVCWACDAKPWHTAADYPCGTEPPRKTIILED